MRSGSFLPGDPGFHCILEVSMGVWRYNFVSSRLVGSDFWDSRLPSVNLYHPLPFWPSTPQNKIIFPSSKFKGGGDN